MKNMLMHELEEFIDAWGRKPDEWFVVTATATKAGLSHHIGGRVEAWQPHDKLAFPDGAKHARYIPGDMVRA